MDRATGTNAEGGGADAAVAETRHCGTSNTGTGERSGRMAGTALVTGAAGFVGRNLLGVLAERGWHVVGTDLEADERARYYTETDDAPHPVADTRAAVATSSEFVPADLTRPETLRPLFEDREYDVVSHAASLFDYFAEWETLHAVNVEGARTLVERAASADVGHLVHLSTLGVLGDAGFDEPKDEDAAYNPHNRYCESKQRQEEVLGGVAAERDLPLTVLRPAPVYGPGNVYGVYHVPPVLSKVGVAPVLRIYPREKQPVFPSIHVEDLCRLALYVHERSHETAGEVYNALSDCIPQDELVAFLADAVNARTVRVPVPYPLYRAGAAYAVWHSRLIQETARERGTRPKIDAPITEYLAGNMWFSNRKVRDLGFEFTYADPKRGLWDYVTWCKERGKLP